MFIMCNTPNCYWIDRSLVINLYLYLYIILKRQNFCNQIFFVQPTNPPWSRRRIPLRPEDRRLILATKEREGVKGGIRNK